MTSDAPELVPTTSTDRPLPVVEALADPPEGVLPLGAVAPSLASVVVTPEPPVVAASVGTERAEIVEALERLRGALVSAGRSLDRVVATAQGPEGTRPTAT